jgi:hypothetical protein
MIPEGITFPRTEVALVDFTAQRCAHPETEVGAAVGGWRGQTSDEFDGVPPLRYDLYSMARFGTIYRLLFFK